MNRESREIIPGQEEGSMVSSINCDRWRHFDLAVGWRNIQRQSGLSQTVGHI